MTAKRERERDIERGFHYGPPERGCANNVPFQKFNLTSPEKLEASKHKLGKVQEKSKKYEQVEMIYYVRRVKVENTERCKIVPDKLQ